MKTNRRMNRKPRNLKTQLQKWRDKQLHRYQGDESNGMEDEMTWTQLQWKNIKRETELLLMVALNNVKRTNCIKAKINRKQEKSNKNQPQYK